MRSPDWQHFTVRIFGRKASLSPNLTTLPLGMTARPLFHDQSLWDPCSLREHELQVARLALDPIKVTWFFFSGLSGLGYALSAEEQL